MRETPGAGWWSAAVAGCVLVASTPAWGQEAGPAELPGFPVSVTGAQARFEQALLDAIHPDSVGRWARALGARAHVAGTEGQIATRDSVIRWHTLAGVEAAYDSLILYMPHPVHVSVRRTWPEPAFFDLAEPALEEDPATGIDPVPVFNAYSGVGTAEGDVVFAGYGLPADYRTLDSAGISALGKIVLARYGRSFRGIKAREAEARGALGLLLYSDPANDGFVRGPVYPEGPMRPPRGVQRGSVLNATGDPSTPNGPSLPGVPRVPEEQMAGVPRIPVIPVGYEVAEALLAPLGGPVAPESWQGGLEIEYRFGPGPTRARLEVETETGEQAYHAAYNTIAVIEGSEWPDEWVVIGAHRDSWSPGAIDNVSGTSSVVEVARAFGALAAEGMRPRRTVVFVTWDAEEWGVIGSIEWVEAHADRLRASVVAYINQDAPVSGSRFGAAASPELKAMARDAARRVEDPVRGGTVYEAWYDRVAQAMGADANPEPLAVGDLGGGSDHKGFYQHLGIPAIGFGFGGSGGVYHSMYDTPRWMQEFGDPGYLYHAAVARIAAVVVSRLANAPVLPYDFAELADVVAERTGHLEAEIKAALAAATATEHVVGDAALDAPGASPVSASVLDGLADLKRAIEGLRSQADMFASLRDRHLAEGAIDPEAGRRISEKLRAASQSLTSEAGLPGDAWSRQLLFASDPDNGYATLPLPAIRLALRAGDLDAAAERLRELARHLDGAADFLAAASELLEGQGASS